MQIEGIQNFGDNFITKTNVNTENRTDPFEKFFDEAIGLIDEANIIQKEAQQKQIDFITGKTDDIIGLSMAQSRASSAIQFTSQVTSKIINAYQEIMRISI